VGDLKLFKRHFGAFVSGSSDLHAILQVRNIDTLIVTATATNVCCESTARYAMMLSYKVIFVSDGNATEHNATLGNMLAMFADVISTREVVKCLAKATIKPPNKGRSRFTVLAAFS
jgi:ureidoacrylate peracid hydrolase